MDASALGLGIADLRLVATFGASLTHRPCFRGPSTVSVTFP